jgi:MinD-like ATPase involved in chromosome partitioning or flagellar assembly
MKNVLIISKNNSLGAELEKTGFFLSIKTLETFNRKALSGIDILIVYSSTIPYSKYSSYLQEFLKKVRSNYYIASDIDTYSTINKTLSSYGIIVIPPLLSEAQVSQKICSYSIEDFYTGKSAVSFFGTGPGAGVSMISKSAAEVLSNITEKEVCFLSLNGEEGSTYFDMEVDGCGISEIKERLINNILSAEELKSSCVKSGNLYFLPGEKEIPKVRYYHPSHIEKLVDLSSKAFDITVINAGSAATGMSIGALNSSKLKYLVTTQSEKYFKNFTNVYNQILTNLGMARDDFSLILNKYFESSDLDNEIVLAKRYGMQVALVVPYLDYFLSLDAEKNSTTLTGYDRAYASSIKQLSVSICSELGVEVPGSSNNDGARASFFRRIKGKV